MIASHSFAGFDNFSPYNVSILRRFSGNLMYRVALKKPRVQKEDGKDSSKIIAFEEEALIKEILAMSRRSMESHEPTLRDQHPKSHAYRAIAPQ